MVIRNVTVNDCTPQTIVIGRRGTYDTMQIAFDLSYLIENYGSGTAVLAAKRSQDESAYPAVVTQDGSTLTWTISETDTYYVGSGECQLMWYVNGGLAKTIIYPMVVMRDILSTAEEPPDGYENWIEHLNALGAETQQNAQDAAQSATDAEDAKDDAVAAKEAAEAVLEEFTTPTASATTLSAGSQATAEYSDGNFAFGIPCGADGSPGTPGAPGADGVTPDFSIGTVTTLEPTQPATATITGTPEAPVLNLGIPKGAKGDPGQGGGSVNDVQIDGNSIVSGGVADIPIATSSTPGVSYPYSNRGLSINADGQISVTKASDASVKAGSAQYAPVVPSNQHGAAFYGLAKAAGDETQAASDNPVGTYTDNAKAAIKDMIGATAGGIEFDDSVTYPTGSIGAEVSAQLNAIDAKQDAPQTAGTAGQVLGLDSNLNPAWVDQTGGGGGMNIVNLSGTQITQVGADNTFYVCGELTELTFTAPAVGITMIRFTSGTTPTVCSFSGVTSWMYDFDPDTDIEASKTYDINVLNGIGVAGWA